MNQIEAGDEIMEHFSQNCSWVILQAQMQSGKTDSFLWVAAEMLRRNDVDHVVVMCGSSETTLRDDMVFHCKNGDSDFWECYSEMKDIRRSEEKELRGKISVIYRQDLKNFQRPAGQILWIWDESHYAQTQDQTMDKFMTRMGLDPTGGNNRNNDLVISVSATGFSEQIDNTRCSQDKKVVCLRPGNGYIGIEHRLNNDQVVFYDPKIPKQRPERVLQSAIAMLMVPGVARDIGIVRAGKGKSEVWVREECRKAGILADMYDGDIHDDINDWLDTKPGPRVILLKGRCRMGKRLHKQRISWGMETSPNIKSDTILQSLIGRLCGYTASGSSDEQFVMLPKSSKSVLTNYAHSGVVDDAMNVPKTSTRLHNRTVPEKMTIDLTEWEGGTRQDLAGLMRDAAHNNTESKNDAIDREAFLENVMDVINVSFSDLGARSFRGHEDRLEAAWQSGTILESPGTNCGIRQHGKEVRVWFHGTVKELGDQSEVVVYFQYATKRRRRHEQPTKTTGREVFCQPRIEVNEELPHACVVADLSARATGGENHEVLCNELMEIIREQQNGDDVGSTIQRRREIVGEIMIAPQDKASFQSGGVVYDWMMTNHGVAISVEYGRNLTGSYHECIKKISW